MLGVRRTTVTLLAQTLKEKGLIRYSRGHIVLTNRKGLENSACECYRLIQPPMLRPQRRIALLMSAMGQ
jgi:Mn-dependent DtxR family transcriptional regulator